MANEVVITAAGRGAVIDKIWVTVFPAPDNPKWNTISNAAAYCNTQNSLRLEGDAWVFARIVPENTPCPLDSFLPVTFDIILTLDDRAIQKIFREVDSNDLARALMGQSAALQDKIFRNMSEKAAIMLKEDMEFIGPLRKSDIKEGQRRILDIYRRLVVTGELFSVNDDIELDDEDTSSPLQLVKPDEDEDIDLDNE